MIKKSIQYFQYVLSNILTSIFSWADKPIEPNFGDNRVCASPNKISKYLVSTTTHFLFEMFTNGLGYIFWYFYEMGQNVKFSNSLFLIITLNKLCRRDVGFRFKSLKIGTQLVQNLGKFELSIYWIYSDKMIHFNMEAW